MFTQSVINYTRCTLDYARPIRVCTQCGVAHLIFEGAYENLIKHQEDCESFLGSFQMEIFDMMYKRGKEMWNTLNCQNCYDYPLETVRFLKASGIFLDCIRIPETVEIISMRSLCKRCPTEFKNMSSMYKRFVHWKKSSVGAICMDIVDRMNYTHSVQPVQLCRSLRGQPGVLELPDRSGHPRLHPPRLPHEQVHPPPGPHQVHSLFHSFLQVANWLLASPKELPEALNR
ncbi:osteopetrosis-associated transmembrane protein 1 [Caerostris extrusa]|uniref:Osteopetrosis-associated transmembrane protein 1 n=1 Tax=Caerostris extrusa TaxID=172846 RepID=A0AAV4RR44_CAEEX|nr:osteopetrosis-associated transmembrane protein 1 [Caerostris extrusa]